MDPSGQSQAYHGGQHYENFPVGSWLVPKQIRPAVLALYRFARTGDDLADEGAIEPAQRLAALSQLRDGLRVPDLSQLNPAGYGPIGYALRDTLHDYKVPLQHAHALLDAFEQDAQFRPLANEAQVLDYCQRSAVPVGRIMLGLFRIPPEAQITAAADAVCTGLQLANFAQDMGEDQANGRRYVPDNWLPAAPAQLSERMADWALVELRKGLHLPAALRQLMRARQLPGALRFPLEIATTLQGGIEICRIVKQNPQAVWRSSPRIPARRIPVLLIKGLAQLF